MEIAAGSGILRLVEGDITDLDTDAIVNAANDHLLLGAGVAGAIRHRGGPAVQEKCDAIGFCPTGGAVITTGGNLRARYVIHAVGPMGSNPQAERLLRSAVESALRVAGENNLSSVAFPAISTGIFGYPLDRCARIMVEVALAHLRGDVTAPRLVVLCLYGRMAFDVFASELRRQADAL
ncbi:MAG: macro domain-containing protein [Anaerolineae bacterium]|nr:macro domain-containing protein [Anaerolineae bacterium]